MSAWRALRSLWMSGEGMEEIEVNSENTVTDEFLKPITVNGDAGRIKGAFFFSYRDPDSLRCLDPILFFNYDARAPQRTRNSRPADGGHRRQGSRHHRHLALQGRISFPCGVPPQHITDVLAEWLSKEDVRQANVAETE
ncbi:hypothetical protein B0H19DRAFT_592559 [Mycena capillaripes]|nr:hypothetical protein B0H19DRAFT_592559 [Mycena capillaripes]